MSDKTFIDDDLKGLEKEIEAAVDRLFVEKGAKTAFTAPSIEPPQAASVSEKEKEAEWGTISLAPPQPPQPIHPLEALETQILSLEWEVTKENLEKTMEKILAMKEETKGIPEIPSVLHRMARVLTYMIQNEEKIKPHLLQFLVDSKETLKLLMKKEMGPEMDLYKRLVLAGMEARFLTLEEFQEIRPTPTAIPVESPPILPEFSNKPEFSGILPKMELLSEKIDRLVEKMDQHLMAHTTMAERPVSSPQDGGGLPRTKITLFKIGERLFGVESDKVEKLFKVPKPLSKKILREKRLRLKEWEIRMVDLENLFSIPPEEGEDEKQVLILKIDGEYKGVMMDRVLNRLSGPLEEGTELNEYIQGMMRWTYQDLPIKVPVLNVSKL